MCVMKDNEANIKQCVSERLLSIKDVSDILHVSIRSVWRLIARGELSKPVKMGNKILRFIPSELEAYIERLKQKRGAMTP